MNDDLEQIYSQLEGVLKRYAPPLALRTKPGDLLELWSEKAITIEGRKRKEVYFAGLAPHKGYIGFYFMPVYVDAEISSLFDPKLLRTLKGKSCFHISRLDDDLLSAIEDALQKGFELYRQRDWLP